MSRVLQTVLKEQTEEKKKEAEIMIKNLEAELRTEEARLSMLRKLRTSQQVSVRQVISLYSISRNFSCFRQKL